MEYTDAEIVKMLIESVSTSKKNEMCSYWFTTEVQERLLEVMQKEIPVKSIDMFIQGILLVSLCPNCGEELAFDWDELTSTETKYERCVHCGQRIDWGGIKCI